MTRPDFGTIGVASLLVLVFLSTIGECMNAGEVVIPVTIQPPSNPNSQSGLRSILTGTDKLARVVVPLTDIQVGSQPLSMVARLDLDVNNLVVNGQYDPNVASFDPTTANGATVLSSRGVNSFSTDWWYCLQCDVVEAPVTIGSFSGNLDFGVVNQAENSGSKVPFYKTAKIFNEPKGVGAIVGVGQNYGNGSLIDQLVANGASVQRTVKISLCDEKGTFTLGSPLPSSSAWTKVALLGSMSNGIPRSTLQMQVVSLSVSGYSYSLSPSSSFSFDGDGGGSGDGGSSDGNVFPNYYASVHLRNFVTIPAGTLQNVLDAWATRLNPQAPGSVFTGTGPTCGISPSTVFGTETFEFLLNEFPSNNNYVLGIPITSLFEYTGTDAKGASCYQLLLQEGDPHHFIIGLPFIRNYDMIFDFVNVPVYAYGMNPRTFIYFTPTSCTSSSLNELNVGLSVESENASRERVRNVVIASVAAAVVAVAIVVTVYFRKIRSPERGPDVPMTELCIEQ